LEAEIAGTRAASFAAGSLKPKAQKVKLKAGGNMRYVVPQMVTFGEAVVISMRAREPAEKIHIRVGNILTKYFRIIIPSQMVRLEISSSAWTKMDHEQHELIVSCD